MSTGSKSLIGLELWNLCWCCDVCCVSVESRLRENMFRNTLFIRNMPTGNMRLKSA